MEHTAHETHLGKRNPGGGLQKRYLMCNNDISVVGPSTSAALFGRIIMWKPWCFFFSALSSFNDLQSSNLYRPLKLTPWDRYLVRSLERLRTRGQHPVTHAQTSPHTRVQRCPTCTSPAGPLPGQEIVDALCSFSESSAFRRAVVARCCSLEA